jgi:L-alanine-DL-glutamate epimerase-like enolase superfamily enzyme
MRIERANVQVETWPLLNPFRISRGAKTEATVVTITLTANGHEGRGECCPYPRYGETVEQTTATLRQFDWRPFDELTLPEMRQMLITQLPASGARNALDCALWDLDAKLSGTPVWQLAGLPKPKPLTTCYTLSLDSPVAMAEHAVRKSDCKLLKLKLGDPDLDADRMQTVRDARPDARLVCDANEGWPLSNLTHLVDAAVACNIELIEQPLAADEDVALSTIAPGVPLCADESAAPGIAIADLRQRYQAVNIKLDKTGGLTAALSTITEARRLGLRIMIGSMVSTSLSMAPAALLGSLADWVDLDSPLLLARDRPAAMRIEEGLLSVPSPELWG